METLENMAVIPLMESSPKTLPEFQPAKDDTSVRCPVKSWPSPFWLPRNSALALKEGDKEGGIEYWFIEFHESKAPRSERPHTDQ